MLVEIAVAVVLGVVSMVVVGTIVRQLLGLRSAINWFMQTAVLFGLATVMQFGVVATAIMVAFPTLIHGARQIMLKFVERRASNGHYGEEAKWAYELVTEEEDEQFIHAQTVLPDEEVMEISIIADSKQELRDMMVERYNEVVSEELSDNADKFNL
jgi:hypothetical protein